VLYKRIANAASRSELDELQVEMIDRFGLLPEATKNLFAVTELKLQAMAMGIRKIEAGPQGGRLLFDADSNIDPGHIVKLIQGRPRELKLENGDKLRFTLDLTAPATRVEKIAKLLAQLTGPG